MEKKIYLYSDKIKSGKTSRLLDWTKLHTETDGILAPLINNKRHLYRIKTNETHLLECDEIEKDSENLIIGNYIFRKDIFIWAQNELLNAYSSSPEWLLIDEIGFLELKNEGLEPSVTNILTEKNNCKTKIVLVVRDFLIDSVKNRYKLLNPDFIFSEFLI
jgi:nucleoside-triphosphatase THEP1